MTGLKDRAADPAVPGRPQVQRGQAWQSAHALHREAALRELCGCVERAAQGALRSLRVVDAPMEITGCWLNTYGPGAAHRMHSHPNNYLSAVYYVQTWPGADSINFHDPRSQTGVIRAPVTGLTGENADQVVVHVKNGMLLVFPSYLQHSVEANAGTGDRVSVSFNLMFSEFSSSMSRPMWGEA